MQEFFEGLAEILEIDVALVTPELHLQDYAWDSLAVVSTMALVDDIFSVMLDGQSLSKCLSVADIVALIEGARKD
ncbi:acyl carrier protein [Undibacterium sp. SXout7W]|uniref:acyl carrier protein n=1 Tax=Undibacterium sp. SXout7W TaxID=3413049 RepID=UPI003BEFAA14